MMLGEKKLSTAVEEEELEYEEGSRSWQVAVQFHPKRAIKKGQEKQRLTINGKLHNS